MDVPKLSELFKLLPKQFNVTVFGLGGKFLFKSVLQLAVLQKYLDNLWNVLSNLTSVFTSNLEHIEVSKVGHV